MGEKRYLTWAQFDLAVRDMAKHIESQIHNDRENMRLYGVPRGGLCLAVALSHALKLPMIVKIEEAGNYCIILVDEIIDTGGTLCARANEFNRRSLGVDMCVAWIGRTGYREPKSSVLYIANEYEYDSDDWFVFPWEQNDD